MTQINKLIRNILRSPLIIFLEFLLRMMILRLFFCFLLLVKGTEVQASKDDCKPHAIRFPFRLKGKPDRCGFELSCTKNKQMVLELPQQVKLVVKSIDYKVQTIWVSVPHDCLQLQHLNLSASPFHYINNSLDHYVFFNCSREANSSIYQTSHEIPCLSGPGFQVVAFPIYEDYDYYYYSYKDIPLLYCTRTFINFQDTRLPSDIVDYKKENVIRLVWYQPDCKQCEAVGQNCKLNMNSSQDTTECFGWTKKQRDTLKILLAVGIILGSPFVGLVLLKLYRVQRSYRAEKKGQLKIEKFLQDYKALKPSRYSYADIKRITNQFKDKLGEGGFGTVFKGRLSNDVLVAVKVLNNFIATGEEFINEVGSMCRIHHVNVTRLIGFCADGNKRALVYEFMHNESLDKFIFGGTIDEEDRFLGWEKLEFIATGIAKGIEYLHHGCDQQILHFDIKPHNILLDHNFNPKISDFGLAKLCSKEQSAVSMTAARGTMGYIAPEVLSRNFGKASHKSDVYSFGMLLLEMVGGRKNIDATVENTSQVYFPEWVYNRLNKGDELEIREENDEVHSKIARKLTIVGLWCIQWYPTDRPSMKDVIHMLEEVESLTMPPNPFAHVGGLKAGVNQLINRELHVIDE